MPMIRLKSPVQTGSLEDNDYTHVKIVEILGWNLMGNAMTVHAMHGAFDADAQEFIPASIHADLTVKRFVLEMEQYSAVVGVSSTAPGEPLGEGFLRAIYEQLLSMERSPYSGVVVDNADQTYGDM